MLVIRVELHSAVTHKVTEIARMVIANTGGTRSLGDYDAKTFRGRFKETLDKETIQRTCEIARYPRLRLHVWNLVAVALSKMGYGRNGPDHSEDDTNG